MRGYGTGSNFTLNAVANLMAEYSAKNCVIPAVVGRSEQLTCPQCKSTNCLTPDKENDAECNDCGFIWAG